MPSFNKITILGHMGRDPETKFSGAGNPYCTFSVATSEKSGEKEVTTWFRVTCFNKTAEFIQKYCKKGTLVYVEGRLQQEEYTDKEGKTRHTLNVKASDVQKLSRDDAAPAEQAQPNVRAAMAAQPAGSTLDDDSSIPF
jgi:single-strand DNA-binding protein